MEYIFFNFYFFLNPRNFHWNVCQYIWKLVNIETANVAHLKGSRCTHAAVCSSFNAVRDGKITLLSFYGTHILNRKKKKCKCF